MCIYSMCTYVAYVFILYLINMPNCTAATSSTKCIKSFDFVVNEHVLFTPFFSKAFPGTGSGVWQQLVML